MRRQAGRQFSPGWWRRAGLRLQLGLSALQVFGPATGGDKATRETSGRIRRELEAGCGMVEAMRAVPLELPAEAWSLVEAGEHAGRLGEAFVEIADLLRRREEWKREVLGQLWYPCLVLVIACAVMLLMVFWMIPQFREMVLAMQPGGRLPWLTEHLGGVFLCAATALFLLPLSAMVPSKVLARLGWKFPVAGLWQERFQGAFPFWGGVRKLARSARLLRRLGTLLRAGLALPEVLADARRDAVTSWEGRCLERCREALLIGLTVEEAIRDCGLFDEATCLALEAGQEAGKLDEHMLQLALDQEAEVRWRLQQAIRFLEPLMLAGLTVAIGALLLAYLLPMMGLLQSAGAFS